MIARAKDNQYFFEEVCFESETNGYCNNYCQIVKRLGVVHDCKSLGSSVFI